MGVGKTFTILAALALARQAGRARRAVIVVPQPIAFQWVANVERALPGFRTVVIGINKTKNEDGRGTAAGPTRPRSGAASGRGSRGASTTSRSSPTTRCPRTQMDQASTLQFIEHMTAIAREVALSRRNKERAVKGELRRYEEENASLEEKLEKAVKKLTPMEAAKRQGAGWVSDANLKKARDKVAELRARIARAEEEAPRNR